MKLYLCQKNLTMNSRVFSIIVVFILISYSTDLLGQGNNNGTIDGIEEMVARKEYMVPMPDGARLATDVFLPILQDNLTVSFDLFGTQVSLQVAEKGTQYYYYPGNPDPWQMPIVFTRTPYNKSDPTQGQIEAVLGYCGIVQDMRGRYASEGVYLPMYSDSWDKNPYITNPGGGHPLDKTPNKEANSHEDGYHTLQWIINDLRWDTNNNGQIDSLDRKICNGNVGMLGASALGNSQYQLAGAHKIDPNQPGLKALVPIVASAEHYHATGHHNGVYRERIIDGWLRGQVERYNFVNDPTDTSVYNGIHSLQDYGPNVLTSRDAAEIAIDAWAVLDAAHYPHSELRPVMDMSRATLDANGNPMRNGPVSRYTFLDVPMYHLTGWWDIFTDGQIQTWQYILKELKTQNRYYQKLILGPWAHQTIGSRTTGDVTYKENVADVLGVNFEDLSTSNIADAGKSELITWFRKLLGEPTVILPPIDKWQPAGPLGEVKIPGDTFTVTFTEFFNFMNGTGPLNNFPVRIKNAFSDTNQVQYITIPATGQSFFGDTSGQPLPPPANIELDASKPNGMKPVRFYVIGPNGNDPYDGQNGNPAVGNYWYEADTFPIPSIITPKPLYLHQNGTVDFKAPTTNEGVLSYTNDPNDPVITTGGNNMIVYTPDMSRTSQGQMDLANPSWKTKTMDRPDVLQFESGVIPDSVSIIGEPIAILYAKSKPVSSLFADVSNVDFIVRIIDVCPDGRELFVSEGAMNICARDYARAYAEDKWLISNEAVDTIKWSNAKSDSIYELKFKMLPIAYSFGQGHKIKILISSSNYPRYQSNPQVPLEENEFFRRRPYESKSYVYQGVTMYSRSATQTIAFAPDMPTHIILPFVNGTLWPVSNEKSIEQPQLLTLYPNPASQHLRIIYNANGDYVYQIHNLVGQKLMEGHLNHTADVTLTGLAPGMYVVSIVEPKAQKVLGSQKLVVIE